MKHDDALRHEVDRLRDGGLYRKMRPVEGAQGTHLDIDGHRVLSLCSNNYLGLADHPALAEATARAAHDLGVGAGASRLISGSMRIHHDLEERLADFKGAERALLFTSGYQANIGSITSLVGAGDTVFSDELNHASLIDGCRLSRAEVAVYRHRDVDDLAEKLRASTGRRKLIVTDSVFSMDGDHALLSEICELAEDHDAMVMVDEAHATGVLGPNGAGLVSALGLQDHVDVQMGTLGKALGTFGAYIAGSHALVEHLINNARTLIFTTALPPPVVAAAGAALTIVESEPERRQKLQHNASRLFKGLVDLGFTIPAGESHILPVRVGESDATMTMSRALLEHGVFAHGIRPPTVPPGTSRIRATVMATHTDDDMDKAIAAFRAARIS